MLASFLFLPWLDLTVNVRHPENAYHRGCSVFHPSLAKLGQIAGFPQTPGYENGPILNGF